MKKTFLLFALLTTGCASMMNVGDPNFSCPFDESGSLCLKPSEVYEKINTNQPLRNEEKESQYDTENSENKEQEKIIAMMKKNKQNDIYKEIETVGGLPIRTKKQIYRVWVAPFIDDKDRLNYSSYVFIDLGKKEWVFDKPEVEEDNFEKQIFKNIRQDSGKIDTNMSKDDSNFFNMKTDGKHKENKNPIDMTPTIKK